MVKKPSGVLYIVATPIGNLEDITLRALRILKEVDLIACEDTRVTLKLLNKFGLKKKLISYFQPKEIDRLPLILNFLKEGKKVALVSDAGTPGISDPGYRLVQAAITENIPVVPIPGASALTTALCACGLPINRFLFIGFPPSKEGKLRHLLETLKEEIGTIIFYLPLRRLIPFLKLVLEILGNRRIVIARELTKIHEEFIRGNLSEVITRLEGINLRGEATILVEGKGE
ncbi:MAG: 16S rRNA (cytidine(1402)-2'-O)-methyltransferase [Candidatus Aminicenantes bacterium]|nr:16S rRNA (cytidine(1402)-2'-O)-methyltransferase [Candidatus Aminicenantes bacterium]